ncbi:MAG: hypothetical protein ABIT38_17730 [Gemmatimonadaceae bacterium]
MAQLPVSEKRKPAAATSAERWGAFDSSPLALREDSPPTETHHVPTPLPILFPRARAQRYRSRKHSSYDVTGGNSDAWNIKGGQSKVIFAATGGGCITHIWFTIAAESPLHLKELVLRVLGRRSKAEHRDAGR